MITRIVKLTFQEDKTKNFLAVFETIKTKVSSYPGCKAMRMHPCKGREHIVFTYSIWEQEDALENYRNSALFSSLWAEIKPWFSERPEAWSVNTAYSDGDFNQPF